MAAYARMADDDSLRKMADRIQALAVRRCGELLEQYDGRGNNQHSGGTPTKRRAAADAGLSKDQQVAATRVAKVPEAEFDEMVNSDSPPSVTELAEKGTNKRDPPPPPPEDFKIATPFTSAIEILAEVCQEHAPQAVAKGVMDAEINELRQQVGIISLAIRYRSTARHLCAEPKTRKEMRKVADNLLQLADLQILNQSGNPVNYIDEAISLYERLIGNIRSEESANRAEEHAKIGVALLLRYKAEGHPRDLYKADRLLKKFDSINPNSSYTAAMLELIRLKERVNDGL